MPSGSRSLTVLARLRLALLLVLGSLVSTGLPTGQAWAAGADADTGFVLDGATSGADVYLDGDKVGTTPLPGPTACQGGEHTIRVARPGYAPYVDVFKVRDGRVTHIEVELVPVAGVLRVAANVGGARVYVDQQYVGEAPLTTELKIGPHQVRVTRFGYRERIFQVTAVAGEVNERTLKMEELPPELNPYRVQTVQSRWYERWWVWTAGAAGVAAVSVAVIVPAVLASRPACDKAGAEICIGVPAPTGTTMSLSLGGTF